MSPNTPERQHPMRKPTGHQPVIQRYSSHVPDGVTHIHVAVFGQQSQTPSPETFTSAFQAFCEATNTPLHHDFSAYTDTRGYHNIMALCYWHAQDSDTDWQQQAAAWLAERAKDTASTVGYWLECFTVPIDYRETIAFLDYPRGLTACPMARLKPMDESGYWGAARDRFTASAYDDFVVQDQSLRVHSGRETLRKHLRVTDIPENLCVIRSGVSWAACDGEQLASYQKHLEPKLNAGMEYLRTDPETSGCCSLRQVQKVDPDIKPKQEGYSLGFFLSFPHLEDWAEHHPTHLAIYSRALAERKKYQEKLQLKTYHEIYVLNQQVSFEYVNCHPGTGMLPYFTVEEVNA